MQVTNVNEFLGGADQVVGFELLRGERRRQPLRMENSSGTPINFTGATLSATAQFKTGTIATTKKTITITNFADPNPAIANRTLTITPDTDLTQGRATLTIPEDLATASQVAPAGATDNVLMAIVYVTYNLGNTRDIVIHRLLIVIRYAP